MTKPTSGKDAAIGCLAVLFIGAIFWLAVLGGVRALFELAAVISSAH